MIPKSCKRIAEVDFPIAVVSKHAAREKSIRHGHPSTLHLWWARRPLAACRAMLLGLLLPDPCDPHCPDDFKRKAWNLLPQVTGRIGPKDLDLRQAILQFIGNFAAWENSSDPTYLDVSRGLVKAAYPEEPPLVVDPFAGGGSIPLEALRLGCDTFASDLNPVACLILKVMLEDIPRHGPELADELRRVGAEIKKQAEKELAEFYPPDPDGSTPIAYLWARTVRCESPNCGAEIPLMRSFWLCKKANRKWALRVVVHREGPKIAEKNKNQSPCPLCLRGEFPHVDFEIFEPQPEKEFPSGTVTRAKATCLCCGVVLPPERVRAQLAEQRGGADVIFDKNGNRVGGARLLAVVTLKPGEPGRHYRLPTDRDYQAVWKAQKRLQDILDEWERGGKKGLCPVPDEPTPAGGGSGAGRAFSVQKYGMLQWGDLFTARQKVGLVQLSRIVVKGGIYLAMTKGIASHALLLGKVLRHCNILSKWHKGSETVAGAFGMHTLPMSWDFPEMFPLVTYAGGLDDSLKDLVEPIDAMAACIRTLGQFQAADAADHPLPDESAGVWFTDPPYYDAIPYSDLSGFYLVWLKRMLPGHPLLQDPFDASNPLAPKTREAVQDEASMTEDGRPKDTSFYEEAMGTAFIEGRRVLCEDGVASVVFAHKTTEGWEALLSGMIRGGWTITGSWPIATERGARLRARESASLATSVHLVCRPRPEDAPTGDWGEILRELPKRVTDWMNRLQSEGIRGADLVFACIGPALEIFSRYSKVETAEGREVTLAEYLEKIWEVVGRSALEQVLGSGQGQSEKVKDKMDGAGQGLEEDARLTALFLWTIQSTNGGNGAGEEAAGGEDEEIDDEEEEETATKGKANGYTLIFDVVRRFAQPLGISLPAWEGRIIKTEKGIVRLLPVMDRAKQLFGEEGTRQATKWTERTQKENPQLMLFPDEKEKMPKTRGRRKVTTVPTDQPGGMKREATTLDRVHAAMLLQAGGQANALRMLIKSELERGPEFLRLANALSALYPTGSEEKRLLDAMLLAVPR